MSAVLISGAGRGIGLACTRRLAAAGTTVYAGVRSASHRDLLGEIDGVHPLLLDVTEPDSIAALDDVLPDRLDAVVNNAGIALQGPVETVPPNDFTDQLDVNVTGPLRLTQAVLPRIRASRGRIVMISSLSGLLATPGTGAYCASKFAIEALTDALRIESRPWKIHVSLIQPGTTRTDMWTNVVEEFDAVSDAMSAEHRELYEPQLTRMRGLLPRMQKLAVDPDKVAKSVEHALTSSRPRRRYRCDAASRAQVLATSCAPAAVTDMILSAATRRG